MKLSTGQSEFINVRILARHKNLAFMIDRCFSAVVSFFAAFNFVNFYVSLSQWTCKFEKCSNILSLQTTSLANHWILTKFTNTRHYFFSKFRPLNFESKLLFSKKNPTNWLLVQHTNPNLFNPQDRSARQKKSKTNPAIKLSPNLQNIYDNRLD